METSLLVENLISPVTLAFLLGVIATLIRSDLEIPEPVIRIFAIFLLFSIGLQGGRELAGSDLGSSPGWLRCWNWGFWWPCSMAGLPSAAAQGRARPGG